MDFSSKTYEPADLPTSCDVNGTTYQTGCYVDGHWGQYGASRVLRILEDVFPAEAGKVDAALYIADHVPGDAYERGIMVDELAPSEIVLELADEAETKLNAATADGFWWEWYEGQFFLSASTDDRYSVTVSCHTYDPTAMLDVSHDGKSYSVSPELAEGIFEAEFFELDEDGDAADGPEFRVWAIWRGGCYIDLCTAGSMDASELDGSLSGPWYSDASDVVNISNLKTDDRASYTAAMAWEGFCSWAQDTINEGSVSHNLTHGGF